MSGQCHHQQPWQQQHLSPAHLSTTIVWEELVSALRPEIWGFQGILILSHNSLLLRSHFDRCGTKSLVWPNASYSRPGKYKYQSLHLKAAFVCGPKRKISRMPKLIGRRKLSMGLRHKKIEYFWRIRALILINYHPLSTSLKIRLFLEKKSSDGDLSPHDRSEEVLDKVSKATLTIGRAGKAYEEKATHKKSQPPGIPRGKSRFVFTWSWMTGWLIIWSGKIEFLTWQKKHLHHIKMWWTYGGPSWFEGSSCLCVPICLPLRDLCKTVSLCVKRCCACTVQALLRRSSSVDASLRRPLTVFRSRATMFRVSHFCPQMQNFALPGST